MAFRNCRTGVPPEVYDGRPTGDCDQYGWRSRQKHRDDNKNTRRNYEYCRPEGSLSAGKDADICDLDENISVFWR